MKKNRTNNTSIVLYKSNSLVRATNAIDITNRLINEQAEYYFKQGELKCRNKDYRGGIENYNKAIELNPNYSDAYYSRGRVKEYPLKEFNGAIEDYDRVIELNPNYADAYYSRGWVKSYNLKDYNGAIEDYNKIIELNPKDSHGYYNRGYAKHYLEDNTST